MKESRSRVEWAESKQLDIPTMAMHPGNLGWDAWLDRFVSVSGIVVEHAKGPGWFLVAYYG